MKRTIALFLSVVFAVFFAASCADRDGNVLAAPTNLAYANGTLTWTAVEGAENGYTVLLRTTDYEETRETVETKLSVGFLSAGAYTATVSAKPVDDRKAESMEISFTVEAAPYVVTPLDAPTHIIYDDRTGYLSWDCDPEAEEGWSVVVFDGEKTKRVEEIVLSAKINVSTLGTGIYNVEIVARAVEGKYYESLAAQKLFTVPERETQEPLPAISAATGVKYKAEEDVVVWSPVVENNGYFVEIFAGETRVLSYDGIDERVGLGLLPLGGYRCEVTVCGDGIETGNAEATVISFTIESRGTLPAPQNPYIENGYLVWSNPVLVRKTHVAVTDYSTGEEVPSLPKFSAENRLFLTDLGLEDGLYHVSVSLESNRYDNTVSEPATVDFMLETAAEFSAAQIANFSGSAPYGEHGAVSLITENGVQYAEVRPTADGWGRVASSAFALDFSKNPVCFMEVGYVFGGYHLQLQTEDLNFYIVRDTNRLGNANGDLAAATGLTGKIDSVRLRIGVNSSTTEVANDARVRYRKLSICYVSEVVPPDPAVLKAVTDMTVRNGGVEWTAPADTNVNAYRVKVTDGEGRIVCEKVGKETRYEAASLPNGIYTVSVSSRNTIYPDVLTESEEVSCQVRITSAVRYGAAQLDTTTGDFESLAQGAPNNVQARFDGVTTQFNSTNVSVWGYIGPRIGIALDIDKEPTAVVRTARAEGGYFVKCSYDGSGGVVDVVGNVSARWDSDRDIIIPLSQLRDGTISGKKTNYKFMFGCLAAVDSDYKTNCDIVLYGIDIVYVEEYVYVEPPAEPVKLDAPKDIALDGGILSASSVKGNSEYTPVYDVKLTGGDGVDVLLENTQSPQIDLDAYSLTEGTVYTVSVRAKGDGVYYSDSDWTTGRVSFSEIASVTDFTDCEIKSREGNGFSVVSKGPEGLTFRVSGGNWALASVAIYAPGLSESARLHIEYGDVTPGTVIAGRYYNGASGSGFSYDLGGDHTVSSGQTEIFGNLDRVSGDTLYLGFGMGGGGNDRTVTIKSIRIVGWKLL